MGGRGSGRGLRGARTRGCRRAEARRGARGRGGHHARRETRPSPFPPRKRAARPAPWPAAVRLRWRSRGSPSTHRVGAPHTSHARYVSGDVKIRRGRSIRTPACQRPEQKQPWPSSFPDRCARQLGVTAPRRATPRPWRGLGLSQPPAALGRRVWPWRQEQLDPAIPGSGNFISHTGRVSCGSALCQAPCGMRLRLSR